MSVAGLLTLVALIFLVPRILLDPPATGPEPEVRGGLRWLWWINAAYCAAVHRLDAKRSAPLPEHGPALLISNHTCGVDPLLLQARCHRVLGFLVAREFFEHWFVGRFCHVLGCIPVKRDGRDLGAARAALRALEAGRVVPIFPEGDITPESGRVIEAGKPGVAFLVLKAKVPVIPAYIRGTPATRNVWLALATPSHAHVVFGDPIDPAQLTGDPADRATLKAVTERMMAAIVALKEQSDAAPQS